MPISLTDFAPLPSRTSLARKQTMSKISSFQLWTNHEESMTFFRTVFHLEATSTNNGGIPLARSTTSA